MKYITFRDNKISKLSLGTVQFGLSYGVANKKGQPTQIDVDNIVDYVISKGVNCFDTAQAYGNSEEVLGKSLYGKNFIVSKVKSDVFIDNFDDSMQSSLQKLNVESLFGLLLHDMEIFYHDYSLLQTKINLAKSKGYFKYFGVSIYSKEDFDIAINNDLIDMIQLPFNIFDQRAISEKWFERAREKNKLIFIRSIFLQGLLLMDSKHIPAKLDDARKYIYDLDKLCHNFNMTRLELSLAFVEALSQDSILLFGCDSLEQAQCNISLYDNYKSLSKHQVLEVIETFCEVPEKIYIPTNW
ncbi:aldo/keto reductase [Francisella sp. 19X1-34]|uniref:aldo/keto reductase n=1 Tax=Francisella sp. 19X1-34 TaxID=3087177 RepID=UPI002E301ED1|nr:aldo/keto reductase [Francisella sp. 19X1-34]MED7787537.1 aldo/keto reductase [Francisella sp. 19X1-34]